MSVNISAKTLKNSYVKTSIMIKYYKHILGDYLPLLLRILKDYLCYYDGLLLNSDICWLFVFAEGHCQVFRVKIQFS